MTQPSTPSSWRSSDVCVIAHCGNPVPTVIAPSHLCLAHYQWYEGPVPGTRPVCTIAGCEQPYDDYGFCHDHLSSVLGLPTMRLESRGTNARMPLRQ